MDAQTSAAASEAIDTTAGRSSASATESRSALTGSENSPAVGSSDASHGSKAKAKDKKDKKLKTVSL